MVKAIKLEVSHGVRFDLAQWEQLMKVAKAERVSVAVIVRRAVAAYLNSGGRD